VVTTATNTVNVAFAKNPTGATLGGTLSVTASQGVATLSGLAINPVGSGYTLQGTSSGLSSAGCNAITVTKSGKSSAIVASSPAIPPEPSMGPLVLDGTDLPDVPGRRKHTRST
jgi:hypothetical protein